MIGSARRAQPVPGFMFTGPVTARSRGTRRGGSGQRCVCAGPVPWLQAACEREPGARAEAAGAWVPLFRWGRPGTAGLPGAVMAGVCREAGAVRGRRPLPAFASWVRPAVVPTPFCGSRKFWSCSRPDSQSRALASAGALAQAGGLGHQLHRHEPPASSRHPALGGSAQGRLRRLGRVAGLAAGDRLPEPWARTSHRFPPAAGALLQERGGDTPERGTQPSFTPPPGQRGRGSAVQPRRDGRGSRAVLCVTSGGSLCASVSPPSARSRGEDVSVTSAKR